MRVCVFILSFNRARARSARALFLCVVSRFEFLILKISTSDFLGRARGRVLFFFAIEIFFFFFFFFFCI